MNRFNPRKLRLSKWTACQPENCEKHFLVTDLGAHLRAGRLPFLYKFPQPKANICWPCGL